jgi:Na+:H+ antiporter, NhaA family
VGAYRTTSMGDLTHEGRNDSERFLGTETVGAVVLLAATAVALLAANTGFRGPWEQFWGMRAGITIGTFRLGMSLAAWVSDALMALFFLVMGLEIKRQILVGDLSKPRQAILPVVAAAGGMLAPVLLYLAVNAGGAGRGGWGVPMATDVAFALGVLALLGSRVPSSLKVFLVALAIADDIGAVLVIAVFYSRGVSWGWLGLAAVVVIALLILNRARVDSLVPYLLLGSVAWFALLNSGVHSTLAGILIALAIPSRAVLSPTEFTAHARRHLARIDEDDVKGAHVLEDDSQQKAALHVAGAALRSAAPLQRLEWALHPVTTFVILPLFALANAGVHLESLRSLLSSPVAIGVVVGLVAGKPIGVLAATWLAGKAGLATLPEGITRRQLAGTAVLAGIGFTMSLFVAGLAFSGTVMPDQAKAGVLLASTVAGVIGYAVLRGAPEAPQPLSGAGAGAGA